MAQPTKVIQRRVLTEPERQQQALQGVIGDVANNAEAFQQTIRLLQELHDSGLLEAANALLTAKEKVAKIALGQVTRPAITNTINNVMGMAGVLSELDPEGTKKLLRSVTSGLDTAGDKLEQGETTGMFDLLKALRDPDINRAITFGLGFLQGMGKGLQDKDNE